MCGILAILDLPGMPARAARHAARADHLLDRLAHRGPDGRGSIRLSRAWLGHRRLAIVDPENGRQPFVDEGLSWVANAEVFNHHELRARYGAAASRSDCAVIGTLWRAAGERAPAAIDGQFAFVCVDSLNGTWIAARDHVGISPLYVGWHEDGTVWFASEMKALIDDCRRVELVVPGHAWCADDGGVRCVRWYRPDWESAVPSGHADPDAIRSSLIGAVRKRLMSDVPWGVLLSGGVDSSIVAAVATRLSLESGNAPPKSFSIGLAASPDLEYARRVAGFLGTDHHEITFSVDDALKEVPAAVNHLESYQQIRTAVPTMLLAEAVRKTGTKMVLSGEGADEILGGYLYFHRAPSPRDFHDETVRKTFRLHLYDVMRANKAPMAHGVELRFPFLDRDFMDLVMSISPEDRMTRPGQIEKRILRRAFDDRARPWLPHDVLWRQKEQFSDGVGYEWVDAIRRVASRRVPADRLGRAAALFPEDVPVNAEIYWMRELFEERFVRGRASGRTTLSTIGTGRSIACSTPEAVEWDPAWSHLAGDISGRAISDIHASKCPLL